MNSGARYKFHLLMIVQLEFLNRLNPKSRLQVLKAQSTNDAHHYPNLKAWSRSVSSHKIHACHFWIGNSVAFCRGCSSSSLLLLPVILLYLLWGLLKLLWLGIFSASSVSVGSKFILFSPLLWKKCLICYEGTARARARARPGAYENPIFTYLQICIQIFSLYIVY